jgi:hypothetical protein
MGGRGNTREKNVFLAAKTGFILKKKPQTIDFKRLQYLFSEFNLNFFRR